jgi:diadenylate cyclase
VAGTLSALEIEDLVTVRDAMSVSQRLEMVRRIADEIEGFVVELGTDGRLLRCSSTRCSPGRGGPAPCWCATTCRPGCGGRRSIEEVLADLRALSATELLDLSAVARCYGLPTSADALRLPRQPPGLPPAGPRSAAAGRHHRPPGDHFGGLQKLLAATIEDLLAVEGVGEARARGIREGLSRLAETSILDRYS